MMSASANNYRPTCPVVFFERSTTDEYGRTQLYTIHCAKLNINIECYLSTAMIKLQGEWTNRTKDFLDCVFALPTSGTVRNITINIGPKRAITTAILSNEDAKSVIKEKEKQLKKQKTQTVENENENDEDDKKYTNISIEPEAYNLFEQYVPDLFRLPFSDVAPNDTISITCEYIECLDYYKKGYILSIPLYFPSGTMVDNTQWKDVVSIECKICSLSKATKIDCWTHHIKQTEDTTTGIITIKASNCKPHEEHTNPTGTLDVPLSATGRDFELSYSVKTDQISAQCISAPDIDDPDSGSLCILVTPPRSLKTTFGRAFFFLIDRSGSMVGEPFREATRALNRALDRLRPSDQFNIAAIDHRQVYYQPCLVPATLEMRQNAKSWIQTYVPERGGTNLDIPVKYALEILDKSDLLPFMVLFIDGSVVNEREICRSVETFQIYLYKLRVRFITVGIGAYVNNTFMTKLAHLSRGFSDAVYFRERIYHKAVHLLRTVNTPCLIDLQIILNEDHELLVFGYISRFERKYNKIPKDIKTSILAFYPLYFKYENQKRFQVYPFPVPDLFIGAPVVVTARYTANKYPKTIIIRGFDPHGDQQIIKAKVKVRNDIPVEDALIKQQIDVMAAEAWFKNSKTLEQKVVDASINSNMPSAYTTTLMIETTQDRLKEEDRIVDELMRNVEYNKYQRAKVKAKIRNNKKSVAQLATHIGVAGAGVGIVAVGLFAFGDLNGTMNNFGCMGVGDVAYDDIDLDDCDCDCDADCDCDVDCIIM